MASDLPILLTHGSWVWKLGALGVTGTLLAAVGAVRGLAARRHARSAVDDLRNAPLGPGEAVVRGRLRTVDPEVVAAALEARADAQAHRKARRAAWIETPDGDVVFDGMAQVVAGHERRRRRGAPNESEIAALDGVEVVARGQLTSEPSHSSRGYREGGVVRVLRGYERPIQVAAMQPRTRGRRVSLLEAGVTLGAVSLVSWLMVGLLADAGLTECERRQRAIHDTVAAIDDSVVGELADTDVCAIGAMRDRTRAARALTATLEGQRVRSEAVVRDMLAVAELAGDCDAVRRIAFDAGLYDEATASARRCGDRRGERAALAYAGRFAEASAITVAGPAELPPTFELHLAIATGDWARAAPLAQAQGRALTHPRRYDEDTALRAEYFACFEELMRHLGGDAAAADRLRAHFQTPRGAVCAPMLAAVVPAVERAQVLAEPRADLPQLRGALNQRAVLRFAYGITDASASDPTSTWWADGWFSLLARGPRESSWWTRAGALIFLTPGARELLPADAPPAARLAVLDWSAVERVMEGDLDGADRLAAEAVALARSSGDRAPPGLDPAWLPAALALYRPIVDVPVPALHERSWGDRSDHELSNIGLRIGALTDVEVDSQVRELQIALRAGAGDLVRWYLRNRARGVDFAVLSALPRMASRDALCEAMRWRTSDGEMESAAIGFPADSFPVGAALHAAVQRQVFTLCGDTREAARWDAAYRRLAAPLRDPDRVIALLLADGP